MEQFSKELENFKYQANDKSLVILGDSIEALKKIPANSINLIFADAPYNIGKDFGNNQDKWETVSSYVMWCKKWIDECMRVLKADGTMYFMTATQHMAPLDVYVSKNIMCFAELCGLMTVQACNQKKYMALCMNLF